MRGASTSRASHRHGPDASGWRSGAAGRCWYNAARRCGFRLRSCVRASPCSVCPRSPPHRIRRRRSRAWCSTCAAARLNFSVEPELADSRGLLDSELPGRGFGGDVGAPFLSFQIEGGDVRTGRPGHAGACRHVRIGRRREQTVVRAVTEQFTSATAQLSFNFGSGNGWSYISGGIGPAQRTVIPAGAGVSVVDAERLLSLNYGAGARWFIKRARRVHLRRALASAQSRHRRSTGLVAESAFNAAHHERRRLIEDSDHAAERGAIVSEAIRCTARLLVDRGATRRSRRPVVAACLERDHLSAAMRDRPPSSSAISHAFCNLRTRGHVSQTRWAGRR